MDIFVKNLPLSVTSSQLKELFSIYGKVLSAKVIVDHETQVSRGFGFVTMLVDSEAKLAIRRLDSANLEGNIIIAKEARPKVAKSMNFSSRDSVLPRSFKRPKALSDRAQFKDYD